jgi:hypothetical protein
LTNEEIRNEANVRANELVDEIKAKALAAGLSDVHVRGYAHSQGPGIFVKRYTGHIEITFEAMAGDKPRRRTVNDVKKPIDVDKIVALLVEYQAYMDERNKQWKAEFAAEDANRLTAENIRSVAPLWLTIHANASGLGIEAHGLTADRCRAIVAAIKALS